MKDDVIMFHQTISNANPGWDPATSIFTCPYDGYYLFLVTLFKSGNNQFNHYARLSTSTGGDIVSLQNHREDYASGTHSYFSSTMHAIIPCEQGEDVWVKMDSTTGTIYDVFTIGYNQFSGLLIKQGIE